MLNWAGRGVSWSPGQCIISTLHTHDSDISAGASQPGRTSHHPAQQQHLSTDEILELITTSSRVTVQCYTHQCYTTRYTM